MDKYLGTVLSDRYEILEIIGNGGMAVVYKARDLRLNRLVAIKVLKDDAFADEELRLQFRTESEAVAQLNHPNIVNIFDVSSNENVEYIVMELIDGITLYQYMKKRGVLPMKEVLFFVSQILKALDHAHSRNIIHQDIKPQNMMLLRDGTLKVTDFGIARIASKKITFSNNAFGSVHYIAPEQAKGEQTDGRTDIYSVGVILYEMLTGRLPFEGDSPLSVAMQHMNSQPMAPSRLNPDIPKAFEAILLKAMSVDPNRRYPSAQRMLDDIESFKQNPDMVVAEETPAPMEEEVHEPTKKWDKAEIIMATNEKNAKKPKNASKTGKIGVSGMAAPVIAGIVTTVLLLGLAVGALIWAFSSGGGANVALPDLTNKTIEQAEAILAADDRYSGLKIVTESERNDNKVAKGNIIEMKPKAGTTVRSTATVNVVVSMGPVTVFLNDVTGKTAIEATNAIKTYLSANGLYGLTYQNAFEISETVAKDCVIRTEPAAGSEVKEGDVITIVVSSGPVLEEIPMPQVEGLDVEAAKSILTDNKLPCEVKEEFSYAPVGQVIRQSVAPETVIMQGTTVIITVSKGSEYTEPDPSVTAPPKRQATFNYTVIMPEREQDYLASLKQDGEIIATRTMNGGEWTVTLVGDEGSSSKIEVYIDEDKVFNDTVNFE